MKARCGLPRFVFELANNHEGRPEHALRIIAEVGQIARRHEVAALMKFQYRELDSFIHKDFTNRADVRHIPRFLKNRLSATDFGNLADEVRRQGMELVVTPFDEPSVELCLEHRVDFIKVASCCASDWPLLEAIGAAGKPVIVSTGGLTLAGIDNVVSFLEHRKSLHAVMHCVSIYPTPPHRANLAFLSRLRRRYPQTRIGYSGHESPDNHAVSGLAVAMGAEIVERHVGLPAEGIQLNAYSLTPDQVDDWIAEVKAAVEICGSEQDKVVPDEERNDIQSLQRGVYAARSISKGVTLVSDDVYFAMPRQQGQTSSGEFGQYRAGIVTSREYQADEPLTESVQEDIYTRVRAYVHQAKGMLSEAGIPLGSQYQLHLSHHYGIERFREVGAVVVDVVNREYCKKLIILMPGQIHPVHRHLIKEETFQHLSGDLDVELNDVTYSLELGDNLLIERGAWHGFRTKTGAIFEEISTTHNIRDSYYRDEAIGQLDPMQRKTVIDSW